MFFLKPSLGLLVLAGVLGSVACPKDEPSPPPAPVAPAAPTPPARDEPVLAAPAPVTTAEQIEVPTLTLSKAPGDVAKGAQLFIDWGCSTCHLALGGVKAVGPDLTNVLERRPLVYVERMILRPDVMIRTDPTAKALFGEYGSPMTNQRIDPVKDLPFLIDYLQTVQK